MSFSTHLRRGLLVFSLFAARLASADSESDRLELVGDGIVVVGKPETLDFQITHATPNPPITECSDDFEGEGWGCGGGKPCDSWTTVSQPPSLSYEKAIVLEATCDESCDAKIVHGAVEVTGKTASTTAQLRVKAQGVTSGQLFSKNVSLPVTSDQLRVARSLSSVQTPDDVFLLGQTFTWCVLGPGTSTAVASVATTFGPVALTADDVPGSRCHTFVTTAVGTGHVLFTSSDGELTVDVSTVAPADVVAIDFVWLPDRDDATAVATDEVVAKAKPLDLVPVDAYLSVCRNVAARFETRDGRYGLLPSSAIQGNDDGGRTATIGSVTKSAALRTTSYCY
jgi:hypothetical protein